MLLREELFSNERLPTECFAISRFENETAT